MEHMILVHQSVRQFSARFAEELRRHNYVTVSTSESAEIYGACVLCCTCVTLSCLLCLLTTPSLPVTLPHHPSRCPSKQPKNYLDFITNYKRILSSQRKEHVDTTERLSNGLAKLVQVSSEVDVLQRELSQAKVVVEAATRECNQLLEVRFMTLCW